MSAKALYIILMTLVFGSIGYLVWNLYQDEPTFLIASELLILLMIGFAMTLYRKLFRPLDLIDQGIATLKSTDYNLQFSKTGSVDIDQLVFVYNELMERLRNEKVNMIEKNFFLEKLMERIPLGLVILDFDNHIVDMNPEAKKLLTNPVSILGQKFDQVDEPLFTKITLESEAPQVNKIDGYREIRSLVGAFMQRGFPRKFVLLEDLTTELRNTEKAAYDKVIRMMAHEVNNSIGAINSILESLQSMKPLEEEKLRQYLQVVYDRNVEMNAFMKNFADVVRLPEPVKAEYDFAEQLRNLAILFEARMKEENIRYLNQIEEGEWLISADAELMQQVLTNLLKNSIEAVESNRQIAITTDKNNGVWKIKDSGPEPSPGVLDKVLTPFFSTKQNGQGIGLTVVKEVLRNHGFAFDFKRENGWTIFEVRVE